MKNHRPRFTLISSAAPLGALSEAIKQIESQHGELFELQVYLTYLIQHQAVDPDQVVASLQESDVVLFDLRGNPDRAIALVSRGFELTAKKGTPFIPVFGGGPRVLRLLRMGSFSMARVMRNRRSGGVGTIGSAEIRTNYRRIKQLNQVVDKLGSLLPVGVLRHARNWVRCTEYWTNSGVDNMRELFLFVGKEYAGLHVKAHPPTVYPEDGFYDIDANKYYTQLPDYLSEHPLDRSRPTVLAILFGGTTLDACVAGSRELLNTLSERANLIPFFADGIGTATALRRHLVPAGQPLVQLDAIVSLQWFRLEGGPLGGDPHVTYDLLQTLDAPLYTPATSYSRPVSLWEHRTDGVAPVETLATITLPELDGAIEPIFLFGLGKQAEGQPLSGTSPIESATTPVQGRGKRLTERILRRIRLRNKPNAEKRVALVIYNYPPGEGTLGEASFLDVFASVRVILRRLHAEGYTVELPEVPIKDLLLQRGLLHGAQWTSQAVTAQHAIRVPVAQYRQWYEHLSTKVRQQTEALFGPPPGRLMTDGTDFLIAGLQLGNVLLAVQPSRGVHEDPQKIHHDKSLPPHHQYIAFYRYLERGFGADAVVHVGTHGTLEFTPGKECALSADCAPDVLIGTMPHVYIYHVVNASEAMIAKRRSYAQTITYASPSFAPAEMYDEYLTLEDLLEEYEIQVKDNPARGRAILEQIQEKATAVDIPFDLPKGADADATLGAALDRLHADLTSLKRTAIPIGLHTFGERLRGGDLIDYLALIARYDRVETPALTRLLAEKQGLDYDTLLEDDDPILMALDATSRHVIKDWLSEETFRRGISTEIFQNDGAKLASYLGQVRADVEATDELDALVRALDGRFIMPNLAGDPIRSPETYPTGHNAYQFDPTRIPTLSAMERGRAIAEETLRQYAETHGTYPSAVGVILWGFETCKTYGETIGQIVGYLGVRLERGEGYYIQPEPIPLEEMGRPRIDVVVNICGFFRDLFPNQLRMLDLAFRKVAALDEDPAQNRVRANSQAILQRGGDQQMATGRIFGPPPGEYSNRLSTMIESSAWKDESELANMFMERTKYLYGDNVHGVAAPDQLQQCLGQVDLVTQVRDSHEFEVSDLDHYYEFFGGLARAAREVQGGSGPTVLIADTTAEKIRVCSVHEAVRRGVVTRLLNPQWIDGMLAHDFHGAQKIANRVEYLIGLDATTRSVGTRTWSRVADRYVFDEDMRRRILQNNPYASAEIAQRLGEAMQRGYWEATEEEHQRLKEAYLEIEEWIEASQ